MFFLAPYFIQDDLFKHITHKDDILLNALQFLLTESGIQCEINAVQPPDIEADIVIYDEKGVFEIVEVKMHKTDRPFQTQLGNLRTDITKVIKKRESLLKLKGPFENTRFSLVTNLSDSELILTIKKELREELKHNNINIYSPGDYLKKVESGF